MPHPKSPAPVEVLTCGKYLRELRERLGMTLRDVQDASAVLSEVADNEEMYISAARLDQIENDDASLNIHKLVSLSAIYGVDYVDLLTRYVKLDRIHEFRKFVPSRRTCVLSSELHDLHSTVTMPLRMDPGFRWETTQLLNRMVSMWGELPVSLLMNFNPRQHIIGYIGLEDRTMSPLLTPGALVLVDDNRRRVVHEKWANEQERPIYLVELREGYRCAWCQISERKLYLIPHPSSGASVDTFNFPNDAEIVGQVVGVAMRIAPMPGASPEQEAG